ncbi:hypothetical protein F7725_024702 [Dissostichus mawsoni]|uniref:Peptide-N(4)-(N-acetyl-beta-glucosaminyl)asparagine amidase n=1 Tax=Dissostichus mawsoni TaxID=36200 RepID=A0A7J5XAR0_DISMA|nr:hypothetical protein F7725_024702 [Dissostichus mawsoni]
MSVSPAVTTLCENSDKVFLDAAKLLLTYSDNIMRFPNEEKYRSIRIGNPTFSTKLLPIKGAVECLFEMGFEEMKLIRDSIAAERDRRLGGRQAASPITPTTPNSHFTHYLSHYSHYSHFTHYLSTTPSSASAPVISAPPPPQPSSLSNFQHVLLYENLDLQQKALSCIPEERLRYNNPEKLLETRRGRCGEWANCFTLCCRAMDHVWTEVFSTSQRRWLHCDSCENGCDKPLLYEVGWGKKLAYILAFSKDQVVDVTWRYSCKHPEVLSRRMKVQESWLLHTIHRLNTSRQQSLSPERKKDLTERLLVELVEFLSPKKPKSGELGGRNSGSLAWRRARGETRKTDAGTSTETQAAGFVFTLTEKERMQKLLHVRYSSSRDEYCRLSNDSERIQIWDQCGGAGQGSSSGKVSWKFDFSSAGMKVSSVSVSAKSETFHSGSMGRCRTSRVSPAAQSSSLKPTQRRRGGNSMAALSDLQAKLKGDGGAFV